MNEENILKKAMLLSVAAHVVVVGSVNALYFSWPKPHAPEVKTINLDIQKYHITPDIKKIEKQRQVVKQEKWEEIAEKVIEKKQIKEEITLAELLRETKKVKSQETVDSEIKEKEAIFLYQDAIKRRIEEKRRYPYIARVRKYEGVVSVKFKISRDGSLGKIQINKTTSHNILNDEAIKNLQRAQPFPHFPDDIKKDYIFINTDIVFKLK